MKHCLPLLALTLVSFNVHSCCRLEHTPVPIQPFYHAHSNNNNNADQAVFDRLKQAVLQKNVAECRNQAQNVYRTSRLSNALINQISHENGRTLLHLACEKSVRHCQEHNEYIDRCDNCKRDGAIVQALLENGANPFRRDNNQYTPLHIAAELGCNHVIEAILKAHRIFICDTHAILTGTKNLFRWRRINDRTDENYAALHLAAKNGYESTCELLFRNWAEVDAYASRRTCGLGFPCRRVASTPLDIALENGHEKVCQFLITRNAHVSNDTWKKALAGNNANLCSLIFRHRNRTRLRETRLVLDEKNSDMQTGLHIAVQGQDIDFCRQLLNAGCDKDLQDKDGNTPLHLATSTNNLDIVRLLLDAGALINKQNVHGNTALHVATTLGLNEIATELCSRNNIAVNQANIDGYTPLHIAAENDNEDLCRLLIENGASINQALPDDKGKLTPLHLAVKNACFNACRLLLNRRANCLSQDHYRMTPVEWAENLADSRLQEYIADRTCALACEECNGINCKKPCDICSIKYNALNNFLQSCDYQSSIYKRKSIAGLFKDRECPANSPTCTTFTHEKMPCCFKFCCNDCWNRWFSKYGICPTCHNSLVERLANKRKLWEFDWEACKISDDNSSSSCSSMSSEQSEQLEDVIARKYKFEKVRHQKPLSWKEREERDAALIEDLRACPYVYQQYNLWKNNSLRADRSTYHREMSLLEKLFGKLHRFIRSDDNDADDNDASDDNRAHIVEARSSSSSSSVQLPHVNIYEAAQNGNIELLREHAPAIDISDENGMTPLHYAAANGHRECCIYLIQKGARRNYLSNSGNSPRDLAVRNNREEIVELFDGIPDAY